MEGAQQGMIQLQQIRALDEDRAAIVVSWCYSRNEVRRKCTNMNTWPKGCSYVLSTHLQVLMWDTLNGKVKQQQLQRMSTESVVDVSTSQRRWRLVTGHRIMAFRIN